VLELTLPRAATAADDSEPGSTRRRPPTLYVLVVPDGDGVKIAWGADEGFLVGLLAKPRPARRGSVLTLAGRRGLTALNQARALGGGFTTLNALLRGASRRALPDAPHAGRSPVVYELSRRETAAGESLELRARVSPQTLQDVAFAFGSPRSDAER
jgi:hypothetical protein